MNILPILSTLVSIIFAAIVMRRFLLKGGAHLAMWAIGLFLYGIGTLTEFIMLFSFNEGLLKAWYLSGAMLTAAWLGQGTFYFLIRRVKIVNYFSIALLGISLLSIVLIALSPMTGAAGNYLTSQPVSSQYKEILTRSSLVSVLTVLLNIYGTILLIGGALYSAFLFRHKKVLLNRVIGNLFIAAGALSPALGGSLIKIGLIDMLYLSELVGVVLMLIGYQFAITNRPAEQSIKGTHHS